MASKLLLVKSDPTRHVAKAFAFFQRDAFYSRTLETTAAIEDALKNDNYDVIINDARENKADPMALARLLGEANVSTPVILICEALELPGVVQAIRLRVRDLYHPPLDIRQLVKRAEDFMRLRHNGDTPDLTGVWLSEIVQHLAEPMAVFLASGSKEPADAQPLGKAARRKPGLPEMGTRVDLDPKAESQLAEYRQELTRRRRRAAPRPAEPGERDPRGQARPRAQEARGPGDLPGRARGRPRHA